MKLNTLFFLILYFSIAVIFTSSSTGFIDNKRNIESDINSNLLIRDSNPKLALINLRKLRDQSTISKEINDETRLTYEISVLLKNYLFDFNEAIKEANRGVDLGKVTKDHLYTAKFYQIIGACYLENLFLDKALQYLNLASNHLDKVSKSNSSILLRGKIYDNIGSYYEFKNDFENYVFYKRKSLNQAILLENLSSEDEISKNTIILAQYTNISAYHEINNNSDSAGYYLKKANEFIDNNKLVSTIYNGDIYSRLSKYYYKKGDFSKSIDAANKGLNYIINVEDDLSKMYLYESLYLAYSELGETDSINKYSYLYAEKRDFLLMNEKKSTVKTANNLIESEKKSNKKQLLILISAIAIISVFITVYIRLRFKRYQNKYVQLLDKIKRQNEQISTEIEVKNKRSSNKKNKFITEETRLRILNQLKDFEKSNKFLKPKLTLNVLATDLKTNPSYLSSIIKEEKDKNFNQYLNYLRINYIVNLLYNEPNFREYKTSYLAEITGFSSREVFTTTFKKETGLSPFYFIDQLKKQDNMN